MSHTITSTFTSLPRLVAAVSQSCGKEISEFALTEKHRSLALGAEMHLSLGAPEIPFRIDVEAQVIGRVLMPNPVLRVRYRLAQPSQIQKALGVLYQNGFPALPMALPVATEDARPCEMTSLSTEGATFEFRAGFAGATNGRAFVEVPHQRGRLHLPGEVAWVKSQKKGSRVHVHFSQLTRIGKERLEDIVLRFNLGTTPWSPRLMMADAATPLLKAA